MAVTKATPEDVLRLATLSRIEIPERDVAQFVQEFDSILAYVGKLEELTLPARGGKVAGTVRNVLRPDGEPSVPGLYTESIVAQFPQKEGNNLSVKQILFHG